MISQRVKDCAKYNYINFAREQNNLWLPKKSDHWRDKADAVDQAAYVVLLFTYQSGGWMFLPTIVDRYQLLNTQTSR